MAKAAVVHAQQRWEYHTINSRREDYLAKALNELGQSGWELVSIIYGKDAKGETFWNAFVKRPATQQPAAAPPQRQAETREPQPSQESEEPQSVEAGKGFDLSGNEFEIREP